MADEKYQSPILSDNYQAILQAAPQCQINPFRLKELLWLINAHPTLIAFFQVCSNLSHILTCLKKYAQPDVVEHEITDWLDILKQINRHKHRLSQKLTEKASVVITGVKNKKLLHAKKTSFGFYCLLCTVHEDKDYQEHYDLLVGHLLLANIKATREFTTIQEYEKHSGPLEILTPYRKVYNSTLALRRISKISRLKTLLHTEPFQKHDLFIDQLTSLDISSDSEKDDRYLTLYRTFLVNCTKPKSSKSSNTAKTSRIVCNVDRDSGYLGTHNDFELSDIFDSDHDDPMSDWGTQTIIHSPPDDEQITTSTTAPSPDDKIILSRATCKSKIKDLATYHGSARSAARHITLKNQLLPWAYPILTDTEVNLFVSNFHNLFLNLIKKPFLSDKEQLKLETVVLAKIMFWTASSLKRATGARFITSDQNLPCDLVVFLYTNQNSTYGEWRIRSWTPSYTTTADEPQEARDRKEFVYLQDCIGYTNHLQLLCEKQGIAPKSPQIFLRNLIDYNKELKSILNEISEDNRITIYKIANHLDAKIIEKTGDISTAAAITGTKHPLNRSKSHYFTPTLDYLRDTHKDVIQNIALPYEFPHSGHTKLISKKKSPLNLAQISTGSRYCATFEAVKSAIGKIQSDLSDFHAYTNFEDIFTYHNTFTLYTVLMFGFSTGRRPITTPIQPIDMIDVQTGITILGEKDNQHGSKSRPAWVPPLMIEQLRNHQDHCDIIARPVQPSTSQLDFHEHCFFIEESNIIEVKISSIERLMEPYLPLPANFYRRFVRTNLIERGCPAEAVDAWMGHWHLGQEPWGKFSSYSIPQYITQIQQYLLPLLDDLGWAPLTSAYDENFYYGTNH